MTGDGVVLTSDGTVLTVHGGVRALVSERWEAAVELDSYPGRLVHPNFRLAYLFALR